MVALRAMLLIAGVSLAGTAIQSSWSRGPGVQGPVTDWCDAYFWTSTTTLNVTGGNVELQSLPPVRYTVTSNLGYPTSIAAVDIDGDLDVDVATVDFCGLVWWENRNGQGTDWVMHEVFASISGYDIHAVDIDCDGDCDLLTAERETDRVTLWENIDSSGGGWQRHVISEDFGGASSVFSTDVDEDGDMDILGAAYHADQITWWENQGGSSYPWTEHTVDSDFDGAVSIICYDIDGDNDSDIVGTAWYSNEIAWWEKSDSAPGFVWTKHIVDPDCSCACTSAAADLDGDGDTDIVGGSYAGEDGISWWENVDGSGEEWTEHDLDWQFTSVAEIHAADLDGDGDIDVAASGFYMDQVTWWENKGSGTGWAEHIVAQSYSRPSSVSSADMDGDGDPDLVGCALNGQTLDWWDVELVYQPYGSLVSSILDAGFEAEWTVFTSHSQEPDGTSLFFLLRSSNDHCNMGSWSDTIFCSDTTLTGFTSGSCRYLQYKIVLVSSDESVSPELIQVEFNYTPQVGVADRTSLDLDPWSVIPLSNPCKNLFSAQLSLPENAPVDLMIFDSSGRVVSGETLRLSSGRHNLSIPVDDSGVYFCVFTSGEVTRSCRFVIID